MLGKSPKVIKGLHHARHHPASHELGHKPRPDVSSALTRHDRARRSSFNPGQALPPWGQEIATPAHRTPAGVQCRPIHSSPDLSSRSNPWQEEGDDMLG